MIVFIDESGDPGFKVDAGSSPIFVVAMAIFESGADAGATQEALEGCRARRLHKDEFKFSKCSSDVRDAFFETARNCEFTVRAIVVDKSVIYARSLKSNKDAFYEQFVYQMLKHDNGALQGANVVIDGSGDRDFKKRLGSALRQKLREGALRDIRFRDSKRDTLIQLADMCAGAIARSCRTDRPDSNRWRDMLRPRIRDVWHFR